MKSNKWLIGRLLATVVLMSGGLALAQEDSNATVVQDTYVIAGDNSDNNYATQDFLRAGAAPGGNWEQIVYVDDESLWPQLDVTFDDGPPPIDDLKGDVNADLVVNGLDVEIDVTEQNVASLVKDEGQAEPYRPLPPWCRRRERDPRHRYLERRSPSPRSPGLGSRCSRRTMRGPAP